jgi:DNA processing protein
MSSIDSTNLTIISLLELPNIGRKTVFNYFSNFKKFQTLDFLSDEKNYSIQNLKIPSIVERSDSFNNKYFDTRKIENKIVPHFVDYCVYEQFTNEFKENFLEKFKISKNDWSNAQNNAQKIFDISEALGIKIVNYFDENYPSRLRSISDPPQILYYKGDIDFLSKNLTIAVVGTREPTEYGMRAAESLGELLANCDIPVVSGLASGCDAYAQQGCVNNGLDHIYPKQNENLSCQILSEKGCLISEYPPGVRSTRFSFVDRDRLQSGLSDGIIVVETGVKGGTMHTVNYSLKQNRLLGCVSHPPEYLTLPQSSGNQVLISERKATPIFTEYFNDGLYNPQKYSDSILGFIKKIIEIKKIDTTNMFEIIEKFHEYMYKKKAAIEKPSPTNESSDEIKSKPIIVKHKKQVKNKDKSQKSLIEIG